MMNLGNVDANSTLYIPFHTFDSNGASITLTGLAVTDIEIYKNGSVTQRSSDAGYTLLDTDGIDFDGITGIHGFSINLSDNTDAGFYSAGAFYWVVISAVTVDTRTVNFVAATFRIGPAAANVTQLLGTAWLTPGTAGTPDVNVKLWNALTTVALPLVPTTAGRTLDVSAGGEAGVDWANVGTPGSAVNLSSTTVNLTNTVTTYTGNTLQTGDSFARIGATGSGLTSLASAANLATLDDFVDTEIGTIITNIDALPTNAELATALGTADDAVLAAVATLQTSVNDLPTNAELATALGTADDAVLAAIDAVETIAEAIQDKTDSLVFTKANELDVNLQSVNGVTVNGDGSGTPMGV
jgi:hypothetical protein